VHGTGPSDGEKRGRSTRLRVFAAGLYESWISDQTNLESAPTDEQPRLGEELACGCRRRDPQLTPDQF